MIRTELADALRAQLAAAGVDVEGDIHLEEPARREHGDWSSNVAMANAKRLGRNPRELAQQIVDGLNADLPTHVERAEIAGPGFVNFHLRPTWLHAVLRSVVAAGVDRYAQLDVGTGTKVMVEFVSANPTGPLHAGHARGAVYGDALARLLTRAGYEVAREFYINDRGGQMLKMGASMLARATGEPIPEGGYAGNYIAEWATQLPADVVAQGDVEAATAVGYAAALADQREVLGALGVVFDVWFSEMSLVNHGAIEQTLEDLRARGVVDDRDGAVWLRSTDYGDDKDRVLVKSDGSYTYLLPDIAYHRDKFARGFDLLINVWGADHHGYIARMKAAVQALGHEPDQVDIEITQLVKLLKDGQEVKLSKRTGDFIELRDVIDEVGADATRLVYLLQSIDSPQTVDLAVIAAQSMDNPVFYIQMAHARLCSIALRAAERGVTRPALEEVDLGPLVHPRELDVLRLINALPSVIELAARERAPHKVTSWLRELASEIHGFYHDCPILRDDVDDATRFARLWLAEAALVGLRVGLSVLGASAPDSMPSLADATSDVPEA
ncbi:MAG TPA: arginine--tRNA ligase [Microthrixaceae bacterium]|nr:arginine--tRNA ligase [Microthrixaceae bacterium]